MSIFRYTCHCILLLLTGFAWPIYTSYQENFSKKMLRACESKFYQILQSFKIYAAQHNSIFREANSSNEAFRKLFQAQLLDDEETFHFSLYDKMPDGNIGTVENGFREALEENECTAYTYRLASPDSPMPCVIALVRTQWNNYWVLGSFEKGEPVVNVHEVGKVTNPVFAAYFDYYAVDFRNQLAPDGPKEDPMVLSLTAQANRRVRWIIFIPYGLFLIADLGYACLAKRRRKSIPMKPAQ